MRHYFIDFENVRSGGLIGADRLAPEDRITIYYSENAHMIDLKTVEHIKKSGVSIDFYEIPVTGHNALDFALIAGLAISISKNQDNHYYIISQDAGYESAIILLRKEYDSFSCMIQQAAAIEDTLEDDFQEFRYEESVEYLLKGILPDKLLKRYEKELEAAIRNSKSKDEFYRTITRLVGQEKGHQLYGYLRSDFKHIRNTFCA